MYHVNINTSYQTVDCGVFVCQQSGSGGGDLAHTTVLAQGQGQGFLCRRTRGHCSVFERPFPAVAMS